MLQPSHQSRLSFSYHMAVFSHVLKFFNIKRGGHANVHQAVGHKWKPSNIFILIEHSVLLTIEKLSMITDNEVLQSSLIRFQ